MVENSSDRPSIVIELYNLWLVLFCAYSFITPGIVYLCASPEYHWSRGSTVVLFLPLVVFILCIWLGVYFKHEGLLPVIIAAAGSLMMHGLIYNILFVEYELPIVYAITAFVTLMNIVWVFLIQYHVKLRKHLLQDPAGGRKSGGNWLLPKSPYRILHRVWNYAVLACFAGGLGFSIITQNVLGLREKNPQFLPDNNELSKEIRVSWFVFILVIFAVPFFLNSRPFKRLTKRIFPNAGNGPPKTDILIRSIILAICALLFVLYFAYLKMSVTE